MYVRLFLAIFLVVIVLAGSGCGVSTAPVSDFSRQVNSLAQSYKFDIVRWELNTLWDALKQSAVNPISELNLNSSSVLSYFTGTSQIRSLQSDILTAQAKKDPDNEALYRSHLVEAEEQVESFRRLTERTIARQITAVLSEEEIYNPFGLGWLKRTLPPVEFRLEKPLLMLIISPRDRIERIQSIPLKPDMTADQINKLESSVDALNVSALVVQIGGLGATYPTFVSNYSNLQFTLETAAHEWLHQYLAFKPLGFQYILDLLGIAKNYEAVTINETVANIAGREIGAKVYEQYYQPLLTAPSASPSVDVPGPEIDFNEEMRKTRIIVDKYLAQGKIEQAEAFMEDQCQYLASKGYYIRKLNQAYFTFYGSYADGPASVDPIGEQLKQLRKQSSSLKDFLDTVSGITSRSSLEKLVNRVE